ncbi:hypothetical protein GCM10022281_07960 [Sphingomonas rosea]|uniref:FAS1 domain-containing protein n=2 Tax=Sphingomonas rosea TaxID=335605 RepID=A0ABP7TT92_9SPHN
MKSRIMTIALLGAAIAACGKGGGEVASNSLEPESNLASATSQPDKDLAGVLDGQPRLVALVKAAGMERILAGKEPYTILAPSEDALAKLPAGTLDRLQKPEGKAELTGLLRHHILPGTILTTDLAKGLESGKKELKLATMAGDPLTVTREGQGYKVTDKAGHVAMLTGTEQPAKNGVVHSIDAVLPAA